MSAPRPTPQATVTTDFPTTDFPTAASGPRPGTTATRGLAAPGPGPLAPRAPRRPANRWRFPYVVAHRGASGYRPEHTLAAYELGVRLCADFLEPDLVPTRDGVLVARHGPEISRSTDVADHPEFAGRRTTRSIEGRTLTGWFVEDFTLEEIKTLRSRERLPLLRPDNTPFDDLFEVPTLAEILELRAHLSATVGWEVGLYPEIKHPAYHAALGHDVARTLLESLDAAGLNEPEAPVFVPSFEADVLRHLRQMGLRTSTIQLVRGPNGPYEERAANGAVPEALEPERLERIAGYADGIGVDKTQVIPWTPDGHLDRPTPLTAQAHAAGLLVHARNFRAEHAYLPLELRRAPSGGIDFAGAVDEVAAYMEAGVDAVLVDHPNLAVLAREETRASRTGRTG